MITDNKTGLVWVLHYHRPKYHQLKPKTPSFERFLLGLRLLPEPSFILPSRSSSHFERLRMYVPCRNIIQQKCFDILYLSPLFHFYTFALDFPFKDVSGLFSFLVCFFAFCLTVIHFVTEWPCGFPRLSPLLQNPHGFWAVKLG